MPKNLGLYNDNLSIPRKQDIDNVQDQIDTLSTIKLTTPEGLQGQILGYINDNIVDAIDLPSSGSGKRTCRFVVGTSTAGWTEKDCDYLCDGIADEVEINKAIQDLPSGGGEIVILDGTYNLSSTVLVNKSNTAIKGNGKSSRIFADKVMICVSIRACENITVENLFVNSIENIQPGIWVYQSKYVIVASNSIEFSRNGVQIQDSSNCIVCNNMIRECNNGVNVIDSSNCIVSSNIIESGALNGVYSAGQNNIISCNIIKKMQQAGIMLDGYGHLVYGNMIIDPIRYSIFISQGDSNIIIGNYFIGKNVTDSGSNNTIINNKYE